MNLRKQLICIMVLLCVGCSSTARYTNKTEYLEPEIVNIPMFREGVIGLENLQTRTVVYCYDSPNVSAQSCAIDYERQGFVRLKDIPRQTAEYDFLTGDTYPTRRWRNNEVVPRW